MLSFKNSGLVESHVRAGNRQLGKYHSLKPNTSWHSKCFTPPMHQVSSKSAGWSLRTSGQPIKFRFVRDVSHLIHIPSVASGKVHITAASGKDEVQFVTLKTAKTGKVESKPEEKKRLSTPINPEKYT
eukprot:3664048-Pyramimonas_sp.AAC.1